MGETTQQLRALLRKNAILKRRSPISTLGMTLLPALVMLLLVWIHHYATVVHHPSETHTSEFCSLNWDDSVDRLKFAAESQQRKIAFAPHAAFSDVIDLLTSPSTTNATLSVADHMILFESVRDFEKYMYNPHYGKTHPRILGAVIAPTGSFSGPEYTYHVRMNATREMAFRGSPDTDMSVPFEETRAWFNPQHFLTYCNGGFTTLQTAVDTAILIREGVATRDSVLQASGRDVAVPMPTVAYTEDDFASLIGGYIGIFFTIMGVLPVSIIASELVQEKESRVREMSRMMGLRTWVMTASWVLTYLALFTIASLGIVLSTFATVFKYSNVIIIFMYFFCYYMTLFCFAFFMASFFSKSQTASSISSIAFIATLVVAVFASDASSPRDMKLLAAILPAVSLRYGSETIAKLESTGLGVTLGTVGRVVEGFSVADSILTFTLTGSVLFILGLYLQEVMPGEFGVPRSITFCISRKFWTACFSRRPARVMGLRSVAPAASPDDPVGILLPEPLMLPSGESYELRLLSGDGIDQLQAPSPRMAADSDFVGYDNRFDDTISTSSRSNSFDRSQSDENSSFETDDDTNLGTGLTIFDNEPCSRIEPPDTCPAPRALVRLRGLRRTFTVSAGGDSSEFVAVKGLSLDMYEGQIFTLLGHNGAGKSTTFNMLTGLIPITDGRASILGHDIATEMEEVRRSMGVCPQHDVLYPHLSVIEHLELFAAIKGVPKSEISAAAAAMVDDVGLGVSGDNKANALAGTLSGGQKRKLSVGIALIGNSKVVFLDEPSSGMDVASQRVIWDLLLRHKRDRVIVLTTHSMEEAEIGDRIAIMAGGKLMCNGSSLFLKQQYGAGYTLTVSKDRSNNSGSSSPSTVTSKISLAAVDAAVSGSLSGLSGLATATQIPSPVNETSSASLSPISSPSPPNRASPQHQQPMQKHQNTLSANSPPSPARALSAAETSALDSAIDAAIARSDSERTSLLTALVSSLIPAAEVLSDAGGEVSYRLPFSATEKFPLLFDALEHRKQLLGVAATGISVTTLTEVFLRVGDGPAQSEAQEEGQGQGEAHFPSLTKDDFCAPPKKSSAAKLMNSMTSSLFGSDADPPTTPQPSPLNGVRGFLRTVYALCVRRFHSARRDRRMWVWQLVIPGFVLGINLLSTRLATHADYPLAPITLASAPYGHVVPVVNATRPAGTTPARAAEALAQALEGSYAGARVQMRGDVELEPSETFEERFGQALLKDVLPNEREAFESVRTEGDVSNAIGKVENSETANKNELSGVAAATHEYASSLLYDLFGYEAPPLRAHQGEKIGKDRFVGIAVPSLTDAPFRPTSLSSSLDTGMIAERVLMVNTTARDGLPLAINAWGNTVLLAAHNARTAALAAAKRNKDSIVADSFGEKAPRIILTNKPLDKTKPMMSVVSNIVGFALSMALSFIPATFAAFVVRERADKGKHLLLISGVSPAAYWVSTLVWDLLNFTLPFILVLTLLSTLGGDAYVGSAAIATVVVLQLFALASAPFVYCLSYLFDEHSTAQSVILMVNFFCSVMLTIVHVVMSVIPATKGINSALAFVYRLTPPFCLGEYAMNIVVRENYIKYDTTHSPLSFDIAGWPIVYLCIDFVLFAILLAVIEHGSTAGWSTKIRAFFTLAGLKRAARACCSVRATARSASFSALASGLVGDLQVKKEHGQRGDEAFPSLKKGDLGAYSRFHNDGTPPVSAAASPLPSCGPNRLNVPRSHHADGEDDHDGNEEEDGEDEDVAAERDRVDAGFCDCPDTFTATLKSLRKVYAPRLSAPPHTAVASLSFAVARGECFGFLGGNGAGKTTTLKMLTGDELPTSGTALLGGMDILQQPYEVRQIIGYCPQFDALLPLLTAREHLTLYARVKGMPEPSVAPFVSALIKELELDDIADKPAGTYSGGNKRRLSVGIALVGNPQVVFLDEPSTGVDPQARRQMWQLISSTMANRSVILTTHSMEECEALCDRIGIMAGGRLRCLGTAPHLKQRFGSGYQVLVKTRSGRASNVLEWVTRRFPLTKVLEVHGTSLKLRLSKAEAGTTSAVFRAFEGAKNKVGIDSYAVSDTDLEQIFLQIMHEQGLRDAAAEAKWAAEISKAELRGSINESAEGASSGDPSAAFRSTDAAGAQATEEGEEGAEGKRVLLVQQQNE